jgi:hypothetical protein
MEKEIAKLLLVAFENFFAFFDNFSHYFVGRGMEKGLAVKFCKILK